MKNLYLFFLALIFHASNLSVFGQISGPAQVIVNTTASFTHSLSPAGAGTSYVWEAESGEIVYEAWDSIVATWDDDDDYLVSLSLYDSSDYSTDLLDELLVTVVVPVIEYSYDAAGNRTGRQIVYYSNGSKKSKKTKNDIEKELKTSTETMVYPNPTDNLIYLKISNEIYEAGKKQFIMYDNLGKLVMRKDIYNIVTEINVANLKNGIYYLVLIYDNQKKDWKIIKN